MKTKLLKTTSKQGCFNCGKTTCEMYNSKIKGQCLNNWIPRETSTNETLETCECGMKIPLNAYGKACPQCGLELLFKTNETLEDKPWSNLMANTNGFNSIKEQEEWINKGCPNIETLEEVAAKIFPTHKGLTTSASNKIMCRRAAWIKGYKHCETAILKEKNDFLDRIEPKIKELNKTIFKPTYSEEEILNLIKSFNTEFNPYSKSDENLVLHWFKNNKK